MEINLLKFPSKNDPIFWPKILIKNLPVVVSEFLRIGDYSRLYFVDPRRFLQIKLFSEIGQNR